MAEAGIRQKYVRIRTRQEGDERGARHARSGASDVARGENTPQHIIACQGAAVKGNIPRGGIWGQERIGWSEWCEHSGDSGGARERSEHSGVRVGK